MPVIALDATPVDTLHRSRGIGRYAQGLIEGFTQLAGAGELGDLEITLVRAPTPDSIDVPETSLPTHTIGRFVHEHMTTMWAENLWSMDAMLPDACALYHATSMEGIARTTPWVATCHDLIPLLMPEAYVRDGLSGRIRHVWWKRYVHELATRARRVVAISHHVKATLVEAGIPAERIDVIYHGLSDFWFAEDATFAPRAAIRALRQRPFVVFIGGFDRRKNFDGLVRAMGLIPKAQRPELVVVGSRSKKDKKAHAKLLSRWDVDPIFLGFIDDRTLRWLYRRCLGLVFPSLEEGWGLPIVEAMASGAPVVCADFGSMAEASGGAGYTTDVRRPEALASAIITLTEDAELRREMSARGAERAADLTWTTTARDLLATYRRALG